jgi:hypothetical protein
MIIRILCPSVCHVAVDGDVFVGYRPSGITAACWVRAELE